MLLQHVVFSTIEDKRKATEDFSDSDWSKISSLVPNRSAKQCHIRWLFTQNSKGKKLTWTQTQTDMLAEITSNQIQREDSNGEKQMPREWKKISEEFFTQSGVRRTGR